MKELFELAMNSCWGSGVTFEELCNTGTCCAGRSQTLVLEAPQGVPESQSHIPHLALWKCLSKGFQLFLFQSVSVSSPLRKSHEAVALISIWIRNVNAALPYTRKGPSLWKEGRKHLCVCVLVEHTLCCERKMSSCQNAVRRGVVKMVWYLKGSPRKRQSPGSIFLPHFQLCFMRRSGSYHTGDFPSWFGILLQDLL